MTIQYDSLIGQKIGRYLIDTLLGRGRGTTVYGAIDPVIERTVVIKILDRPAADDHEASARFLRDAAQLARLRHPNILPIYDSGVYGGRAYLVRQHTDGGTLRDYLREVGAVDLDAALALLRPIATGLDYAHRQGFVHGNLRPSNIVRMRDGKIYLTDFVVPGAGDDPSAASTIVSAIDDPAYASPERARHQDSVASIDHYVLGVIFYEVLTGRPPFQIEGAGDTARHVLTRHLQAEPPAPRDFNPALGPAVEAVLLRALAKRPDDRYPTGAALIYALNEARALDREGAESAERRAGRSATGPLGRMHPTTDELRTRDGLVIDDEPPTALAASPMLAVPEAPPAGAAIGTPNAAPVAEERANPPPVPSAAPHHPPHREHAVALPARWQVVAIGIIALLLGVVCGLLLALR